MSYDDLNPYYSAEKLGLQMIQFDEDLSYAFNTLCFWSTEDGRVFTAQDSGCSCPIPFEDYSGESVDSVLQKLERVGSIDQALNAFDSFNKDYYGKPFLPTPDRRELENWMRDNFKF